MTPRDLIMTLVVPATAGLAVGFLIGLITGILATLRWVARRREQGRDVPIYTDDDNPTPGHVPWRGREHFSRLGWFLVVLGLVGLLLGAISLYRNQQTASCLAQFNARFTDSTRERAAAYDLDRQATSQQRAVTRDTLNAMANLLSADPNPATWPARRDQFLKTLHAGDARLADVDRLVGAAEQQRKRNPLPAQPDC